MNWRLLLLPLSLIYALVTGIRNVFYNTGFLKQKRFDVPVILVGNLSVGGTGKTPHIEYLIELLSKSYRVATLSRGYGRNSEGFVLAGKGVNATEIGDEPMQYYVKNKNIIVSVCENRIEGIEKLTNLLPSPEVILMDDGFQHRSVKPGLSIMLTAYHKLFYNDFVLPAGDLREPRSGYKRADCIVVTKVPDNISESEKQDIQIAIDPQPGQHLFFSSITYSDLQPFFSAGVLSIEKLSGLNVILFTGIADADPLLKYITSKALSLASLVYPDHYEYEQKDINKIIQTFQKFNPEKTIILTTEKDYLRLYGTQLIEELKKVPCYYIPVKVTIDKSDEFNKMIIDSMKTERTN